MSFLSARDFTLVMLAIVFFAGAACIALLTPLPSAVNAWLASGFSAIALVMVFLAVFSNRFARKNREQARKQSSQPTGPSVL